MDKTSTGRDERVPSTASERGSAAAISGGYVAMLARALAWGADCRRARPGAETLLPDRDVTALGLIAQLAGATAVACLDADPGDVPPSPDWLTVGGADAPPESEATLVLAPLAALTRPDLIARAEAGTRVVLHGCGGVLKPPAGGIGLRLLSGVNPAFWCSGLALAVPADGRAADDLIRRLDGVLGDQSLDPMALYEENCRLRQAVRTPTRIGEPERDLIALRRFMRDRIERAGIAARGAAARAAPRAPIDWSAAFLMPPELSESATPTPLDEAEVRARRARLEAEFLRAQLRAATVARDVDHHDLIAASGFFDLAWYAETYDVAPENAIRHYLTTGHIQGNDPSPLFSNRAYLAGSPDVAKHGFNPLLHYLMDGIYEGRTIEAPTNLPESIWRDGFADA